MSDPLTTREALRRQAEWIRDHHVAGMGTPRVLVHVDDLLAILDALEQPAEPTPATRRERRDADLARLMERIEPRQPDSPIYAKTPGGRHRRGDSLEAAVRREAEAIRAGLQPVVTDARLAIRQGLLVDPDSGNLR